MKSVTANTLNSIIKSIDGGTLIQKFIDDLNKKKRSHQKAETFQTISIGIAIFLNNGFVRSHHFGKKDTSAADGIKSIIKGVALNKAPATIYRSKFLNVPELGDQPGGAIRCNGVTISVTGLKSNVKNEHLAWMIINTIERRTHEQGLKFADVRHNEIIDNPLIVEERNRLMKHQTPSE